MTADQVNAILARKGTTLFVSTPGRSAHDTATGRAYRSDPTVQVVRGAILPSSEGRGITSDQSASAGAVQRTARMLLAAKDLVGASFAAVIGQTLTVAGATWTVRSFTPYLQGITTLAFDARVDS